MNFILLSCKNLWDFWGLDVNEFDFLLQKQALLRYHNFTFFEEPNNILDSVKVLLWSEINDVLPMGRKLVSFDSDLIVLRSHNNLTVLEENLGFLERPFPVPLNDSFVSNFALKDDLVRSAWNQRKIEHSKFKNVYNSHNLS